MRRQRPDLALALRAGMLAITINTALLRGMSHAGLQTAQGGLLRLLRLAASLPGTPGPAARLAFHVIVGLMMALAYATLAEPVLRGPAWRKGLVVAAAVWLLNASVLLPLTGEGFAGTAHIGIAGLLGFAVAHTAFFVILALRYAGT